MHIPLSLANEWLGDQSWQCLLSLFRFVHCKSSSSTNRYRQCSPLIRSERWKTGDSSCCSCPQWRLLLELPSPSAGTVAIKKLRTYSKTLTHQVRLLHWQCSLLASISCLRMGSVRSLSRSVLVPPRWQRRSRETEQHWRGDQYLNEDFSLPMQAFHLPSHTTLLSWLRSRSCPIWASWVRVHQWWVCWYIGVDIQVSIGRPNSIDSPWIANQVAQE